MEKRNFNYGDYSYEYYLLRQERKTVSLTVHPSLNITLKCPTIFSEIKIQSFLKRKWQWLEKQLIDLKKYQKREYLKQYVAGESFLYLGRQYRLFIESGNQDSIKLENGRIIFKTTKDKNDIKHNEKFLQKWYEERAKLIFQQEYKKILKKFNYDFTPELDIRKMEKRWGSFLSKNKILLNPELIKASKDCIDYVIIHELCHMKYSNRNRLFYFLLEAKMPNWRIIKEELELRFL